MQPFRRGLIVALILAILTAVEWIAASGLEDDTVRFIVLAIGTLFEAWLIAWYYMHVYRLWRPEEVH